MALSDPGTDDGHLRDGLQRPLGRVGAGPPGGTARELALEAARRADEEIPGGGIAQVGERVRGPAGGERELALARLGELIADLESDLAFEEVERLVEVVDVQRRGG